MQKILLAEDDKGANLMVSKVLTSKGLQVLSAFNGQEAIELFDSNQIDLVITDIMMPIVDGIELLDYIRSTPAKGHVPIIGFSAGNKEKIFERLKINQFDLFFEKPVDLKNLAAKVFELL
ncbi:DNA-binding response regulator/sensor histidine kinase [Lunatimonas lonarensis]|uniref:DNA-binding response regulator/sensor histidine kinase n=1 Tax=Lunatimonas lonarensis TaxID=1232681 RepID=R7ZR22_9BACT|nr:response regulator [Lunatimonas lonarensis]EON76464.1 DNA-binding response regulator/sensor histidine kinase [Lunatimonas lonarensis]